jgi:outer membrane protein assembly factor BamB
VLNLSKLATIILLALVPVLAMAEDWTQFQGPRGDSTSKETNLADSWPANGPPKAWEKPVGIGYASPVEFGEVVYLFTFDNGSETLTAFKPETGEHVWQQKYAGGWTGDRSGTRCTPIIENGKIYTHGGMGDLVCRNLTDGTEIWHINVLKETGTQPLTWGEASNPLIVGDVMYLQAGKGGPLCVAVNKNDGKIIWKSGNGLGGYTKPILIDVQGTKLLAVFGGTAIYTVNPADGKIVWSYPWKTSYDINASTPLYRDGKLFITSSYGHGCGMFELSPTGGKLLWQNKEMKSKFQPLILEGDAIYGNSEDRLKCISWTTGKKLSELDDRIGEGGNLTRIEGDKMIVQSSHGDLMLVLATPKEMKTISSVHLFDYNEVWATPLLYKGKAYCKGKDQFVCLDISKK